MNPAGNVYEMFTELVKFEISFENVKKKKERKISKVPDGKFRANIGKSELYSIQSYMLYKGYITTSSW